MNAFAALEMHSLESVNLAVGRKIAGWLAFLPTATPKFKPIPAPYPTPAVASPTSLF